MKELKSVFEKNIYSTLLEKGGRRLLDDLKLLFLKELFLAQPK